MDSQCNSCNFKTGCEHQGQPDDRCLERFVLKDKISKITRKFLVMSGKGGVGKSSVAVNLALTMVQAGKKVGILDVDIHGPNIPKMLGVEGEKIVSSGESLKPVFMPPGLKIMSIAFLLQNSSDAVIWRGPLKMSVIQQFLKDVDWGELDCLIIDAPPGTGDEPLSIAQLVDDAEAIIVTTPQDVSILDVKKSITFCKKLNMKIAGMVENMSGLSCPHCNKEINLFKSGGGKKLSEELNINFMGKIPIDPEIVNCGDEGTHYVKKYPQSTAAKSFKDIVSNLKLS